MSIELVKPGLIKLNEGASVTNYLSESTQTVVINDLFGNLEPLAAL